jgi:hypothetical protein
MYSKIIDFTVNATLIMKMNPSNIFYCTSDDNQSYFYNNFLKVSIPLFSLPLSFVLKQFEFGGCSLAHFHCILKNSKMQKIWVNLQPPNSITTIFHGLKRRQ